MTEKQEEKNKIHGWNARLLSPQDIRSIWLPESVNGKFYFESDNHDKNENIYIEAIDGAWVAYCADGYWFLINGKKEKSTPFVKDVYYPVIDVKGNQIYALYLDETGGEISAFLTYQVRDNTEIRIGRANTNDIIYTNQYVSRSHAVISFRNGNWIVRDEGSMAGIFLNEKRIHSAQMHLGDVFYIIGLRIIIGVDFIAIAGTSNELLIDEGKLKKLNQDNIKINGRLMNQNCSISMFNRAPRFRNALAEKQIEIESPPMSLHSNQIPMMLRMGGSMAMGASSIMSGNYMPLLSSLLFPMLTNRYTTKQKEDYEKKRNEKYTEYLQGKRKEIQFEKHTEEELFNANYPPLNQVLEYSANKKGLWNRRKTDDDFMFLRVGYGDLPLMAPLSYQKQRFELEEDPLDNAMHELAETPVYLENVPILVDLKNYSCIGVQGNKKQTFDFVIKMILRLSLLYSYDELKMVFLADDEDLKKLDCIKNLPHMWDDQRSIRFIASQNREAYQIGEYFRKQFEDELKEQADLKKILKRRPYYVVFALNRKLFECIEIMKDILQQEQNCGFTAICAYEDIPKETGLLMRFNPSGENDIVYLNELERKENHFIVDPVDYSKALSAFSDVSNTYLKLVTQEYSLPKTLTFLEMFSAGKVEHLNIVSRWKDSNPVNSLAAPVGVGTDGSLFTLDLHQKYQGPHGLVAGMTGSGKSEFLITYILSMAIMYHPDEVAFVLIDYKGGGLAGAFDDPVRGIHLPHLIGTITNLDGSIIQRSITSLESELKRRQRVFNHAKSISAEGTMDIYTYQRLYRNKVVQEPMPHLFIISDEFAELKQQQPEFMEQLISIARIGRSLGVHLILATQKPSGVVNDQIRSNTKFQVCLKVQDRSDSMDMIKRPDAAELKETGRFYLQVGYNEYFALGQSAWSGASYEAQDKVVVNKDNSIQFVDNAGQVILDVKPVVDKSKAKGTHLTAIVQYISDLAVELGIPQKSLWLPPLKEKIDLSELDEYETSDESERSIKTVLGLIDDPANQTQYPAWFDIQKNGNMLVIGEQGSGKTTFVQSLLLNLSKKYEADDINYYLIDYSSNLLKLFEEMPHCGAVIDETKEGYISSLFDFISDIVEQRKQLFRKIEADNFETAKLTQKLPLILIVIDNYSGVLNSKAGKDISYGLDTRMKEWAPYGIRFLITVSHLNEVTVKIKQELTYRLALKMKDSYEYGEALNIRTNNMPAGNPGRGLYLVDEGALEIQIGMFDPDSEENVRIQNMKEYITDIASTKNGSAAEKLPMFSETEEYEHFIQSVRRKGRIPLGYDVTNSMPVALPFKQLSMLTLYLGNKDSRYRIIDNFLKAAEYEEMKLFMIQKKQGSILDNKEYHYDIEGIHPEIEDIEKFVGTMIDIIHERQRILESYCTENGINVTKKDIRAETFDYMFEHCQPCMIFVEGFADLCEALKDRQDLQKKIITIFNLGRRFQIYVIGCFFPEEESKYDASSVYLYFNEEKMMLLSGEHLDEQKLVSVPMDFLRNKDLLKPNRLLMHYGKKFYPFMMPCGEFKEEDIDVDMQSIFRK